jgi:cell division protein WhiA
MSGSDRALVDALRAEVAGVDPVRDCDQRAELAGLGSAAPRDRVAARLSRRLARLRAAPDVAATDFDFESAAEHCRSAYLRGRFLAAGSLSLAGGRTHLEFVVAPAAAPRLAAQLALVGLPASWRVRRGRGVVTWKGAETIGTFLRRIGAGATLLELEARQVARAMRGEMNRVLNAESANLQRTVAAAGRQLAAIDQLESVGQLTRQPAAVRAVAEGRRRTPEATLGELASRLGFHRSAVQRALDRLERVAADARPTVPQRRRRTRALA